MKPDFLDNPPPMPITTTSSLRPKHKGAPGINSAARDTFSPGSYLLGLQPGSASESSSPASSADAERSGNDPLGDRNQDLLIARCCTVSPDR